MKQPQAITMASIMINRIHPIRVSALIPGTKLPVAAKNWPVIKYTMIGMRPHAKPHDPTENALNFTTELVN